MSAFLRSLARPASGVRAFSTTAQRGVARITIIGNLGGTPELRASSTGREYIRYAVASSSGPVSNRTTSWFNVRAFVPEGPQRDFFLNLPKGSLVVVDGDVTVNNVVDEAGNSRQVVSVVQQKLEVVRRPNPNRGQGEEEQAQSE